MKQDLLRIINEINSSKKGNYNPVKEEKMPAGYFTSKEFGKKYKLHRRDAQRVISMALEEGKLLVKMVRVRTNIFVKRIPVYKFKRKSYETSIKSRLKGKL